MIIDDSVKLDFNNVLIKPKRSTHTSRKDVELKRTFKFPHSPKTWTGIPICVANMDTVGTFEMAEVIAKNEMLICLHKFYSLEDWKQWLNNKSTIDKDLILNHVAVTCGINIHEYNTAKQILTEFPKINFLCIDVANGYQESFINFIKQVRSDLPDIILIAGNVVSGELVQSLILAGADIVKCGIGSGCAAKGTRILMENGSYKNIEDIKIHDRVINSNGDGVDVIGIKYSGMKKVKKYKNNLFYKYSLFTEDHQHLIGDYSTISNIQKCSLRKTLQKPDRFGRSKIKWKQLENCENTVFLIPKIINFKIKESFTLNLSNFTNSKRFFKKHLEKTHENINPSYELGYIFGTFLGDGYSTIKTSIRKSKSGKTTVNTSGGTAWYFGINEQHIANKVSEYMLKIFNIQCKIEQIKNTTRVYSRCNNISRMFLQFGKRENKHLPEEYMCSNMDYINGLLDGLIDSDGHISKTDGRFLITNTSSKLIEQYMLLFKLVHGYYPSIRTREPSIGGLKNAKLENCKETYSARSVIEPDYSFIENYQINRNNSKTIEHEEIVATYDIEVDCPTHSFIANNAIVHNSSCSTRLKAGVGQPQLSTVIECSDAAHGLNGHVMSDGGIIEVADLSKAFCGGADFVMCGSMFAGHDESAGDIITEHVLTNIIHIDENGKYTHEINTKKYKLFYGMSSDTAMKKHYNGVAEYRTSEGRTVKVPYKGAVQNTIHDMLGGIRSCCTYIGAKSLKDMPKCAHFIKVYQTHNTSLLKNS